MEIAFCRIDDRLIHGQVATVWSKVTGCNRIMCVSDEVAKDELRKKLLLQVVPPGLKGYVVSVEKACEAYKNPKFVEDILRDVVLAVRQIENVASFEVECENFESIHNHNAFASHAE